MAKEYEVSVDDSTEVVTTKKEVDAIVKDALADGETHEVAVTVVEPEATREDDAADAETTAAPAPSGMAPQGIPVI